MEKLYKNKEWLEQQYIVEKKSTCEIAEICNCHNTTIGEWLKKFNIVTRTPSENAIQWEERINKNGTNGCWDWTSYVNKKGYGIISGKKAHRVSWEFYNDKKIRNGYEIHHKCENKKCVNPAHLQEMTKSEHSSLSNKGKIGQRGEKHKNSKLKEWQVLEIRAKYATGNYSQRQLAKEYNVSQTTIFFILNKKAWKYI